MREQTDTIDLPQAWADDITIWPLAFAAGTAPAGRLDDDDDCDDDGPDPYDGVPADTRDTLGSVWP
jgi:hypothetical protein